MQKKIRNAIITTKKKNYLNSEESTEIKFFCISSAWFQFFVFHQILTLSQFWNLFRSYFLSVNITEHGFLSKNLFIYLSIWQSKNHPKVEINIFTELRAVLNSVSNKQNNKSNKKTFCLAKKNDYLSQVKLKIIFCFQNYLEQ